MYRTIFNSPKKFSEVVDYAVKGLEGITFDVLVFRGFSGALVGPTVASKLNKPWALIRKSGDSTHSGNLIEGTISGSYVIIDDFIDSGETIRTIIETVRHRCTGTCQGVILYDQGWIESHIDRPWWESSIGTKILNWRFGMPELVQDNLYTESNFMQQAARANRIATSNFVDYRSDTLDQIAF